MHERCVCVLHTHLIDNNNNNTCVSFVFPSHGSTGTPWVVLCLCIGVIIMRCLTLCVHHILSFFSCCVWSYMHMLHPRACIHQCYMLIISPMAQQHNSPGRMMTTLVLWPVFAAAAVAHALKSRVSCMHLHALELCFFVGTWLY